MNCKGKLDNYACECDGLEEPALVTVLSTNNLQQLQIQHDTVEQKEKMMEDLDTDLVQLLKVYNLYCCGDDKVKNDESRKWLKQKIVDIKLLQKDNSDTFLLEKKKCNLSKKKNIN